MLYKVIVFGYVFRQIIQLNCTSIIKFNQFIIIPTNGTRRSATLIGIIRKMTSLTIKAKVKGIKKVSKMVCLRFL